MSILSTAGGALTGGLWKVAALGLLVALPLVGGAAGFGWWLAARDRDAARVDLVAEQGRSADLTVAIREQNRAVDAMRAAKTAAETRGAAARLKAAEQGRRFDGALQQIIGAHATSCDEAMPAVNRLWEAVR
jgi:hypothetical protein